MSRSRLQSLNSNIDHMKCSLSSKNSPRNTVDFEAACSVYIRFRGVNGYIESRYRRSRVCTVDEGQEPFRSDMHRGVVQEHGDRDHRDVLASEPDPGILGQQLGRSVQHALEVGDAMVGVLGEERQPPGRVPVELGERWMARFTGPARLDPSIRSRKIASNCTLAIGCGS